MASLTQWTWVWASSGSWWWTGRPGVLQSMRLQRVRHDWATELNWGIFWEWCSVQSLSHVQLFVMPWTTAHQTSLCITNSQSMLKLVSIELVMPSNHHILCCPLLVLPSIFPSIRIFISSLCQVAKVLEFQLQHQFFQWLFRNDFLFLRIDQFDRQHFLLFLYKRDKQLFPKVSILHPSRCFFPPALPFHSEVLPTSWNLGSKWAPQFMTSVILVKFFKPLLFLSDFIRLLWGLNENMYVKFWVCSLAHSKYLKKYFYYWFLLSSSIFSPIYKHAQKSPVL